MAHAVVCAGLGFSWPDGTAVFSSLDFTASRARTGLIGANGSGKSTLLRLIAGELKPGAGSVHVDCTAAYLPQDVGRSAGTVSDLLRLTAKRDSLRRIENGEASLADFDIVGDDWDVDAAAVAALALFGLTTTGSDPLTRPVSTLSGGEVIQIALAGCWLQRPDVLLLDEPTNNLDRAARERLYDAIASWSGVALAVSHDRELLDLMDATAEVRDGTVRTHGGNWTSFRDLLAAEQQAALRMVRVAETDLKREQRQLAQALIGLDRRQRYGRKTEDNKRYPNIVVQKRKRSAQESGGRHRILQLDKVFDARTALDSAADEVRDDARIRIELPGTVLPAGRTVLEMRWRGAGLIVRGPERIALIGPNGAGKTSLLTQIAERATAPSDLIRHRSGQIGYLPQRLDLLDDQRSVLDNVRGRQPHASPNTVRASLARFLLRGDRVDQPARTLSGGERFRASLAMLLLADPPPELLLLDEPTNSLDLESAEQLATALAGYHGALIVASHDLAFIESIGVQRFWALDATGVLNDSAASP